MHIRHILPEPEQGVLPLDPLNGALTGLLSVAFNLALLQARAGHRVEIIAPSEDSRAHRADVEGVAIRWLPLWNRARFPRYDLRLFLPLLIDNLRAPSADIHHVHNNPYLLIHRRARAAVMQFHNPPLRGSSTHDVFMRRAGRAICCSGYIKERVAAEVNYPAGQLVTIHNGIHADAFQAIEPAHARQQFGIDPDALVVLFSGRIVPEKGFHVLLKAWQQVLQARPGRNLVLAAAGSTRLGLGTPQHLSDDRFNAEFSALSAYERDVEQLAATIPPERIRFLGSLNREAIRAFYRAGDVFVCPSTWEEPFGLVNAEAMAAGLPVIASDAGGIPEIVQHEQNGLLVPKGDADALANAILRLVDDADARRRMTTQGLAYVRRFDWSEIARQIEAVYEACLHR